MSKTCRMCGESIAGEAGRLCEQCELSREGNDDDRWDLEEERREMDEDNPSQDRPHSPCESCDRGQPCDITASCRRLRAWVEIRRRNF